MCSVPPWRHLSLEELHGAHMFVQSPTVPLSPTVTQSLSKATGFCISGRWSPDRLSTHPTRSGSSSSDGRALRVLLTSNVYPQLEISSPILFSAKEPSRNFHNWCYGISRTMLLQKVNHSCMKNLFCTVQGLAAESWWKYAGEGWVLRYFFLNVPSVLFVLIMLPLGLSLFICEW